jgi:FkbH-like protein
MLPNCDHAPLCSSGTPQLAMSSARHLREWKQVVVNSLATAAPDKDLNREHRAAVPAYVSANALTPNQRIAAALFEGRDEISLCLMKSVANWDKYREQIAAVKDLKEFLRRDYHFMVDYLALRFKTGDETYRSLYVGEKIRQAYFEPESSPELQIGRRRAILEADGAGICSLLQSKLQIGDFQILQNELAEIERILTTRGERALEVLFIGDCLYLDVTAFLTGACLADGITLNPTLVTSRNPAELLNVARTMAERKFDLIFFSPFSYENSPGYERLQWPRHSAMSAAEIDAVAHTAVAGAIATLNVLGELFDCSVFVHNSANVRRHDGSLSQRCKNIVSWRARRMGRRHVNARLAAWVAQPSDTLAGRLFVFDEMKLLAQYGETALGRTFYNHDSRHPAGLGRWVAQRYRDIIAVQSMLVRKKVVICDLDETLWKGVIGEGAVEHYLVRQAILKRLQAKGVVLAINSKNDPKNIRWDGALLTADDFVSTQINWDTKVLNIRRISEHLNLKTKDFVFVDDRADEREMVRSAMPEVLPLDALADRTWQLLDLWSHMLTQGSDRTRLYQEKNAREGFLRAQEVLAQDPSAMFTQLELTVSVREVKKSDLKRVVELINRTNQFNTCGSRTSLREAAEWLESADWHILAIDCQDKFGSMGTISVCVVHRQRHRMEIPVFVLSCRVFGYGIEHVVINTVKRMARKAGLSLAGHYEETSHNEPCRQVYPANGFRWEANEWVWNGEGAIEDPPWLKIRSE